MKTDTVLRKTFNSNDEYLKFLKDTKYTREAVKEKLETVDIGEYFSRFTVDEVVEVIVE